MILLKFSKIFENDQKISEIFFLNRQIFFVEVEFFSRWLLHELLGSQ